MSKKLFLATSNEAKILRFKNLINNLGLDYKIYTPADFGLTEVSPVENGATLTDNALIKAKAYLGKVNMPIISNDTGFWVKDRGLIDAPKRITLAGSDESTLTKDQISNSMLNFWKQIARDNGGEIDAAWMESFILLNPDGSHFVSESKREVILTDTVFGLPHVQFPVRALYICKTTNKPAILHTPEEEIMEMKPVSDALEKLLK